TVCACQRRSPPCFGGLDLLPIDNPRTGLAPFARGHPHIAPQQVVQARPGPVLTPATKVVIDYLPRRAVVRQQPPRAAAADNIKNAVEDFALRVVLRSSAPHGMGPVRSNGYPFVVGEVGWVRLLGFHTPILPQLPHV